MQIDPFLFPYAELKSKWIKDLHMKPDTLNLIEEKVGESLKHIGTEHQWLMLYDQEQNTNGLCSMIKNQQMKPHKKLQ